MRGDERTFAELREQNTDVISALMRSIAQTVRSLDKKPAAHATVGFLSEVRCTYLSVQQSSQDEGAQSQIEDDQAVKWFEDFVWSLPSDDSTK